MPAERILAVAVTLLGIAASLYGQALAAPVAIETADRSSEIEGLSSETADRSSEVAGRSPEVPEDPVSGTTASFFPEGYGGKFAGSSRESSVVNRSDTDVPAPSFASLSAHAWASPPALASSSSSARSSLSPSQSTLPQVLPLTVAGVSADSDVAAARRKSTASPALPLWEFGGFALGVSQLAYPGADQQVDRWVPLPFVIYRGRFLRADRETAGLRAIRTPRYEVDVGFAAAFAARSTEIDARRGMPELGTLIEFGPRLKINLGELSGGGRLRLDLPLRGVFDLNDGGAHRGVAFEPRVLLQQRLSPDLALTASAGAIVGDRRLARTFYAVDTAYARADRPAYSADSGLIAWRLASSLNYALTPQWRLFGFGRIDSVAGAANQDSPLVRQTTGLSLGLGVFYTWLRSERTAQD